MFGLDRWKTWLRALVVIIATVAVVAIGVVVYQWLIDDDRITYVDASIDAPGHLTGVFVLPDDGAKPFLEELDAARESIRLYLYLLSDNETIDGLIRAHRRGVDVRVMLEQNPYGGAQTEREVFDALSAAGIDVRWGSVDFRFTHIKTMVLDDRVAMIMTLNMTETAFESNREFAVITTNPLEVDDAITIFESDWDRAPDPAPGPLVVSPSTSRSDLLDVIASAQRRLDVYAEFITDGEIVDALIDADSRGVEVRLVMSESGEESLWDEAPGVLVRNGVDVRIVNRVYIHAKALIVDDGLVWTGSQNFTSTSLDMNRELGIIVTDPETVARFKAAFGDDFAEGKELKPPTS